VFKFYISLRNLSRRALGAFSSVFLEKKMCARKKKSIKVSLFYGSEKRRRDEKRQKERDALSPLLCLVRLSRSSPRSDTTRISRRALRAFSSVFLEKKMCARKKKQKVNFSHATPKRRKKGSKIRRVLINKYSLFPQTLSRAPNRGSAGLS